MKHNIVLGIFTNRTDAEGAVSKLEDHGYNAREISILVKDEVVREELTHSTGANVESGVAEGVVTGGLIGGVVGLLVGVGAITIPGIGAVLIGGPIAAALGLAGAAAVAAEGATTGAVAGGVLGALIGLGLPEEEAKFYDERLREGAIILAVSPKSSFTEAQIKQIFADYNAQQMHYLS